MANELMAENVLKVMREEADADGTVFLPKVKARLSVDAPKEGRFAVCLDMLIHACRYEPVDEVTGRLIAHVPGLED